MKTASLPELVDPTENDSQRIKRQHFLPMLVVSLILSVIFGTANLYLELYYLGLLNLLFAATITFSILAAQFLGKYSLASWAYGLCIIAIHPINIYASGGINSPMLIWIFTLTAIIFYFYEPKPIVILLLPYYALTLVAFYLSEANFFPYQETSPFLEMNAYRVLHFLAAALTSVIMFRIYNSMIRTIDQMKTRLLHEKQNLIAILCHDITNPATCIDAVVSNELAPKIEKEELIQKVKKFNRIILDIVNSVRDLEALGAEKAASLEKVNLDEVLSNTLQVFRDQLAKKSMGIEYRKKDNEDIFILANKSLLSNNVLSNLISNSIKFSKHNTVIKVEGNRKDGCVEILIKDQGVGMPTKLVDSLFESYFTRSRFGTDGERGTGLGTGVVRTSLALMGGKISVQSKDIGEFPEEHGTEFRILLPAAS